jgi:threonine/homoserine/homoserine lactone efflux protein
MDANLFIQGIIIGLTLAVPVGPISLLCIQRSVADGPLHGIISGIGVASADSFYAAVSFLGLTIISGVIIAHQYLFRFVAGIVLILIGIRIFLSVPAVVSTQTGHETYLKDYLSMVAIAIANPMTLVFFLVVVPGFGIVIQGNSILAALEFVAGVFCGSTVWWILLCGSLGTVRTRISEGTLVLINRISGIFISCFGAGMLLLLILTTGLGGYFPK